MTFQNTLLTGLERNEAVLKALREAARGTSLFANSTISHPCISICKLDKLYLNGEGEYKWQELFHNHYEEALRDPAQPAKSDRYLYQRAPDWLRWRTPDRLAYAEHLPRLVEALRGLPVSVSDDRSWVWLRDSQSTRPGGRSQYKAVYELFLSFNNHAQFDPDRFLAARRPVCESLDPRADRCIFELAEDAGVPVNDGSYGWTKTGFNLRVWRKDRAEELRKVFPDCAVSLTKEKCSVGVSWTLQVDFP